MTESEAKEHMKTCPICRGFVLHLFKSPCIVMEKYMAKKEKKK